MPGNVHLPVSYVRLTVIGIAVRRPAMAASSLAVASAAMRELFEARSPPWVTSRQIGGRRETSAKGRSLTFDVAPRDQKHLHCASSSSKDLACFKSNVSKPSVNQP